MNNRRQRSGAVGASPVSSGVTPGAGAARPPAAVPSSGRERGGLGAPSEGAGGPASGN
jgi:hypothetical protein